MKKLFFTLLLLINTIPPFAHAQSDDCIMLFTNNYFDWFRTKLRTQGGNLKETLLLEQEQLKELLILLENTDLVACNTKNKNQITNLQNEAKSYLIFVSTSLVEIEQGLHKGRLSDEFIATRSNFKKVNARLVKDLMYETGILW